MPAVAGSCGWAMLGSNQRPPPCRGGALPAELIARRRSRVPALRRYARTTWATWRSGYAAACKAVYTGSIPVVASNAPDVEAAHRTREQHVVAAVITRGRVDVRELLRGRAGRAGPVRG